jgi:hypothetical protein
MENDLRFLQLDIKENGHFWDELPGNLRRPVAELLGLLHAPVVIVVSRKVHGS